MSRFLRNLLITQGVLFLVTQVAMLRLDVPLLEWLSIGGGARWGLAWSWLTYPLLELPTDSALLSIAILLVMEWLTIPRFEAAFDRRWMLVTFGVSLVAGGLLATLVTLALGTPIPVAGAFAAVYGLWAFEGWARRNAPPVRMSLFGQGEGFPVTGLQLVGALVALALIKLVISRVFLPAHAACDLGAIAGGILAATLRERTLAKQTRKHAFGVIRGGRDSRPRDLH